MKIEKMNKENICHYCHENFNGVEEGLIQTISDGSESYYCLRCVGKLMVYRIEGVLPQHLFMARIEKLNEPLPEELKDKKIDEGQSTLDEFTGDEEE